MFKESSKSNNENTFSETTNMVKEEMICKDGFCSLPNQKEISKQKMICKDGFCSLPNLDEIPKQDSNETNLFDPI